MPTGDNELLSEDERASNHPVSEAPDDTPARAGGPSPAERPGLGEQTRIEPNPAATWQTMLAVGCLTLVTVISFALSAFIGAYIAPSPPTYWLIEMIFGLLCGGAGALVGGSADVRSALNLPGSPVHARLGGAVAMIIVGFSLAYLAAPSTEPRPLALAIFDIPPSKHINGVDYQIYVGPTPGANSPTFTRRSDAVLLGIPVGNESYQLRFAVYVPAGNASQIVARCDLELNAREERYGKIAAAELTYYGGDTPYRLHFSDDFVKEAAALWARSRQATTNSSCVDGELVSTRRRERLGTRISLVANAAQARVGGLAKRRFVPYYSVLVTRLTTDGPQDPILDVPPEPSQEVRFSADASPGSVSSSAGQAPSSPMNPGISVSTSTSKRFGQDAIHSAKTSPAAEPQPARNAESTASVEEQTKALLRAKVDDYVRGQDFDRLPLYEAWGKVQNYVVDGFRREAARETPATAKYINLIANALSVIENGRYLPPNRQPGRDSTVQSERLSFAQNVPAFGQADYEEVVKLLCSPDKDTRHAAQRLLKLYPSNHFWKPIDVLRRGPRPPTCDSGFLGESFVYYFYNRIVEFDGTFALDERGRHAIDGNFADGTAWAQIARDADHARSLLGAMLEYAYGLVLADRSDDGAKVHLQNMLAAVRAGTESYPSNPQHIATAVRLLYEPNRKSALIEAAKPYNSNTRRPLNGKFSGVGQFVALNALPDTSSKQIGKARQDAVAVMLLNTVGWDFVQAADQIGWAQRVNTTASN